jgi:uncharacterized protein (TIGR02444 family)
MDSKFWGFSLAVYGAEAVEPECLSLQDKFGLDVNLLLLCAYLGAVQGVMLTADDIAAARAEVDSWHDDIVKPLRAARRRLKTVSLLDARIVDAAAQLRTRVKAAELESEYVEQVMLERWAEARLAARPRGERRDAIGANVAALFKSYGITEPLTPAAYVIAAALAQAKS